MEAVASEANLVVSVEDQVSAKQAMMVDSVVVRNEVKNFQSHPSATTFLRDVYKTGGEK